MDSRLARGRAPFRGRRPPGGRPARAGGQASIELVAALPVLMLAGLVALQLLVTGYTLTLADGAAEAGALALASGRPAVKAAREALPAWAGEKAEVEVRGGHVTVRLLPPSALPGIAERLTVASVAFARPADGGGLAPAGPEEADLALARPLGEGSGR